MAAMAAVQVGARATAAVSARHRAASGADWAVVIPAPGGREKASWVAAGTEPAALVPAPKVRAVEHAEAEAKQVGSRGVA